MSRWSVWARAARLAWKGLWCELREHPYPKTREYGPYPWSHEVIETCMGCGQERDGYVGEGPLFPLSPEERKQREQRHRQRWDR